MISVRHVGDISSKIDLDGICEEGTIISVIEPNGNRHRFRIKEGILAHSESHTNNERLGAIPKDRTQTRWAG